MNIKKVMLISIFLLVLINISAVSAEDNATLNDSILQTTDEDIPDAIMSDNTQTLRENPECVLQSSDNEIIKGNSSQDINSDSSKSAGSENFTITFYDDYYIYGETNLFGFLMPKDIENNVSVEIDAKPYGYEIYDVDNPDLWVWGGDSQTQRGYMVKFSDLYPGSHEVAISYSGDGKYTESRLEKIITVNDDANFHTFSQIQNVIDSVEENSTVILNGTYIGFGEEIIIRKNITLLGVGKNNVLDANSTSRILNITSGSVTLRNLKFINAKNIVNCGGAVYAAGELIVDNCTFKENVVCLDEESGLTVEEIYDKQVSGEMDIKARGGAIYCESNLTVMNSIFYGNDAKSYEVWREMDYYGWQDSAGATTIYVKENMILNNTTITKYGYGGTCDVEARKNLEIYGCQFNGARTNYGHSVTVNNSEFNGRSNLQSYAFEYFGENTSCTILNSIFKNSDKILLRVGNELIVIENNTFTDCNVENNDFILISGDVIEISNNDFSNNSVRYKTMLRVWGGNQVKMSNNTFTDNQVIGNHMFYIDNSIVSFKTSNASIIGCDFINNSASVAGAIYCYNSNLSIDECSFKNNSHVAIFIENAYLKINGKDFGYYSKGLLNDSFVIVPDRIEIAVPESFTFKYPAKDIKIEIPAKLIYNEDLRLSFSIIVSAEGEDLTYLSKDSENGVLSFYLKDDLPVGTYSLRIIHNDYDIDITSKIIIVAESASQPSDDEIIKDNSSQDTNSNSSKPVESENFTITFYDDYFIYGETNIFGFLMPKDIENNVSVEIDAKPYGYEIYDIDNLDLWVWGGDAQTQRGYMVKFSDLSLGDHEVVIAYPGDSYYAENRLVKVITVHGESDNNQGNESFQIKYYTDEDANILGFLMPKDITNKVQVLIDMKDYEYVKCDIDDSNQWKWECDSQTQQAYIVNFSDLEPGWHSGFIVYPGDDKYAVRSTEILIKVHSNPDYDYKLISKLTAANLNAYYKSAKNFFATLKDENGNPITDAEIKIKFNGKNEILKTDDKGQIKLTTSNLLPNSYDVSLTYLGNDYFTNAAAKAKITIKKIVPKISALKKTFKKSLKTKKYTITLKANNKAMKNTKVYLKIKGKTYAAKTNKNGKATFKITKLTKKGTFKATVKYTGNKYYSSKTVNTKIACK